MKQNIVTWLLGLINLTPEEQQRIEKWQEEGITVVWTNHETTRLFTQAGQQEEKKTGWSAAELRKICKEAGVHIYNDSEDVTYAGRNWICIHSREGGKRRINLPFPAKVSQYPGSDRISPLIDHVDLLLAPRSTLLLQLK